jgi:predicted metal-dependent hydrolase
MPISIDHLIRSRRKTIALIIQRDGSLTVRTPLRMPASTIQEFVQNHGDWIRKKQAQLKASAPPPKKGFVEGETFPYLGREFPLTINIHQRPALIFDGTNFHLEKTDILDARQIFVQWYKTQARKVISERIALISKKNDLIYHKVRISSARTRWGSCSSNGTLSFIWRLVLAPPEIIDYVVVHELVHTQIKNHSAKFWRRVADIMPEYKRHVTWLKENGRFLTLGEDH